MFSIKGERAAKLSHATTVLQRLFEPLPVEVKIGEIGFRGPVVARDEEDMTIEPVEITEIDGHSVVAEIGGSVTAPVRDAIVRIF